MSKKATQATKKRSKKTTEKSAGNSVEILNKRTEEVDPSTLEFDIRNPRIGDVPAIAESFTRLGFWGRVVFDDRSKKVLAGKHRVDAALLLKMPIIPVEVIETRDDDHALQIILADNRTSDLATYDQQLLTGSVMTLEERDRLLGTGFTTSDLDLMLASSAEPSLLNGERYEERSEVYEITVTVESIAKRDELIEHLQSNSYVFTNKLRLS